MMSDTRNKLSFIYASGNGFIYLPINLETIVRMKNQL